MTQITGEQRRSGGAIHVVVAENGDAFLAHDRMRNARRRRLHIGERMRIGQQPFDAGIEERFGLVGLDAAAGQHARQKFRNAEPLRDSERARLPSRVETVAPGPARGRVLDAEEEAFGGFQRRRRQSRHRHTTRY